MTDKKPDDVCTCGHQRYEHDKCGEGVTCEAHTKDNPRGICLCIAFTPKEPAHDR